MGNNSTSSQRIYIEDSKKERFPFDIDFAESIKTIKDIIYTQKGIPQSCQILYYNGIRMEENYTLNYYKIKSNSIIQLKISSFDKSKSFIETKEEKSICIFIKPLNLSQISINVKPSTKIEDIKKIAKEKLGIPVEKQNLLYELKTLENQKSLREYNILNNSILHLLTKKENINKENKKIYIRTLDGKYFFINISPLNTIKDIKNKINGSKGIPVEEQKLFFQGKVLEDIKTIEQYNILPESTLHLTIKSETLKNNQTNNKKVNLNEDISIKFINKKIIFIQTLNEVFNIDVKESDTIKSVKDKIKNLKNYNQDQQILINNGMELENDKTLKDYKIYDREIIILCLNNIDILQPKSNDHMSIIIDINLEKKNDFLILEISNKDTIKDIKKRIKEKTGIQTVDQKLKFNKIILENKQTINEVGIKHKSILYLTEYSEIEKVIFQSNETIASLEDQLKVEKEKNQKLNEKINNLEKLLKEKEKIINEETLNKEKDFIEKKETSKNLSIQGEINNTEEIVKLLGQLREKEEEIKSLKSSIPFDIKKGEKIMSVILASKNEDIYYSFICKNTDKFSKLENIFYDEYPEFTESENRFFLKGKKINKYKTLEENKVNNNDIIMINN